MKNGGKNMNKCDHKKLILSFNEFHNVDINDMPEYGDYCFIELKDGRHTAGKWYPGKSDGETVSGEFSRDSCDGVDVSEVAKWHYLRNYDLTECLENEKIRQINLGIENEDAYSVQISDFRLMNDELPKSKQFCLLILNDGMLGAGRWNQYSDRRDGYFIYASALSSYSMKNVWAWTPLSSDDIFAQEEERERERKFEEELNRNPTADPEMFKYGTDIDVYYERALEKLRKEYPWATLVQMKKHPEYVIVPSHGRYIFARDGGTYHGSKVYTEWKNGSSAEEFIDFLCVYTGDVVKKSNPEVKFKYGLDIDVYLEMAYEDVKKDYRWLNKEILAESWQYDIKQVNGEWEYLWKSGTDDEFTVYDCGSADSFIKNVKQGYQDAALRANPVIAEHPVPFGAVDLHGWGLEKYVVSKLQTGDYKVYVQAGDRTTGGSRTFFITPSCFDVEDYDEFLERYLEIVPGGSFGLGKEDLLADKELKSFFGFDE
jgi:hypothetical protein